MLAPDGRILEIDALATAPRDAASRKGNKTVANIVDRSRRIGEVFAWLDELAWRHPITAIVAEAGAAMGTPGTHAVTSLATGVAIVAIMAVRLHLPIAWASPLEWRRTIVTRPESGSRARISEAEVFAAVGKVVEDMAIATLKGRKKSITLREHVIDAVGLGRWGLRYSSIIRSAMAGELAA